MGTILAKRVNVVKLSIPDITSADFDNPTSFRLLEGAEAQDESVESTGGTTVGTDVATAPLYSKLVAIKLQLILHGAAGGELVRWQIVRNPDSDISAATYNTNWHNSDDTSTAREVRANQLAKGVVVVQSNTLATRVPIFIKRKTLRRMSSIKEGDSYAMVFSKDATGTTVLATVWGTMYLRAN